MHLADSPIEDLIAIDSRFIEEGITDLPEFITNQTENIRHSFLLMLLKKAPTLNTEFKFRLRVELSTGEIYETESSPIYFKQ